MIKVPIILSFVFGCSVIFAQMVKPALLPSQKMTETPKQSKQQVVQQLPPGEHLTPKPIAFGGETIPGDSAVVANLGARNQLNDELSVKMNGLQTYCNDQANQLRGAYAPKIQSEEAKIQQSFQLLKKENNWGEDVVMVVGSDNVINYIRLTSKSLKSMNDAIKKGTPEKK